MIVLSDNPYVTDALVIVLLVGTAWMGWAALKIIWEYITELSRKGRM